MLSSDLTPTQNEMQPRARRFAIAWRNTARPRVSPVAVLDYDGRKFRFTYLPAVLEVEDFRPFVGFPNLNKIYETERLWPFFALRVMDRRRPDFSRYVDWLGLSSEATPLDILSRSGGERKGDAVQAIEEPEVDAIGNTESIFLARGARYATSLYSSTSAAESLRPGDRLSIVPDPTNPANSAALLLATDDGQPIGWVPDLLIDYTRTIETSSLQLAILRNNGVEAPWHLRLLIRLTGHLDPNYRAFTGPNWPSR